MINGRSLAISILSAVLSAAPLICAQDAKPSAPPVAIQELALQPQASLAGLSPQADAIPLTPQPPDLSRYREFQVGMTLPAVAKQTGMELAEVTVIHERPVLIQELDWRPLPSIDSSVAADPVEEIVFSFYNGELFRVAVNYSQDRTEGLSEADLTKAISATYGTAARPGVKTTLTSLSLTDASSDKVIARWESPLYSISLVRSFRMSTFGILLLSKRLDALARTASAEGTRIEEREAPEVERARQKQQIADERTAEATARLANQSAFHP
jgi:hypothetical protein